MHIKSFLTFFLLAGLSVNPMAKADEIGTTTFNVFRSDEFAAVNPQGWWLFLGLSTGYLEFSEVRDFSDGGQVQTKIGGSYFYTSPFVLDANLGVSANHIDQGARNEQHLSGVIETNMKYRVKSLFDVGPAALSLLGNGQEYLSQTESMTNLIGIALHKDISIDDKNIFRMGVRALTDVSLRAGSMQIFLFDLQFGLPFRTRSDLLNDSKTSVIAPATTEINARTLTLPLSPIPLREKIISPNPIDEAKLNQLAYELSAEPELVGRVEIMTNDSPKEISPKVRRILGTSRAKHLEGLFLKQGMERAKVLHRNNPQLANEIKIRFLDVQNDRKLSKLLDRVGLRE